MVRAVAIEKASEAWPEGKEPPASVGPRLVDAPLEDHGGKASRGAAFQRAERFAAVTMIVQQQKRASGQSQRRQRDGERVPGPVATCVAVGVNSRSSQRDAVAEHDADAGRLY